MTTKINNETSDDHFIAFKSEAKKWLEKFGLVSWHIEFAHEQTSSRAECRFNSQARSAGLVLSKDFLGEVSFDLVRRSAFHEVCELLLARCWSIAMDTEYTPQQRRDAMELAQHEVIRTLENAVWEESWGKHR